MAKDRIVLLAKGRSETSGPLPGCGPTSIKQIPSGGYWILCHLAPSGRARRCNLPRAAHVPVSSSGKRITWPNDARSTPRETSISARRVRMRWRPAARPRRLHRRGNGVPQDLVDRDPLFERGPGPGGQIARAGFGNAEPADAGVSSARPGTVGAGRVFFDFKAAPAVDAPTSERTGWNRAIQGRRILVADYGNGRVLLLSDQGRFLEQIPVQYRFVTNMAITKDQESVFILMTENKRVIGPAWMGSALLGAVDEEGK